jgi:hypothetical protein
VPPGDPASPPEVTRCSSVPCRPQTPCSDGWMSDAFASLEQARPCPIFWPTSSSWGSPLDYGPELLCMPFGFHLTMDTLPSRELPRGGSRSTLACFQLSPSCPFRLLHTFLSLSGQRGITPAFRYDAPHPSVRGTLTLLNSALLSALETKCLAPREIWRSQSQRAVANIIKVDVALR